MKQGLILAAGRGKRLNGSNSDSAKCLVRVGNRTLIEYQLEMLKRIGIDRVAVVVGHCSHRVREVLGDRVEYIYNPVYASTNSLYSLWLGRDWVEGELYLVNGDLLAHPEIFTRLARSTGTALTFDSSSGEDPEHMKVRTSGCCLKSMSKKLPLETTCGENVGLLRFSAADARRLFQEADRLVAQGQSNSWAPAAVAELARCIAIQCIDIAGADWVEIDFPEDLRQAQDEVWPEVMKALHR